jgi:hypothetical protein
MFLQSYNANDFANIQHAKNCSENGSEDGTSQHSSGLCQIHCLHKYLLTQKSQILIVDIVYPEWHAEVILSGQD